MQTLAGKLIALPGLLLLVACSAPEEEMAAHLLALNDIMANRLQTPAEQVDELGDYLSDHGADMLKLQGELSASVIELEDDTERLDRKGDIQSQLAEPRKKLRQSAIRFGLQVREDREALAALRGLNRRYGDAIDVGILPLARAAYPHQELGD